MEMSPFFILDSSLLPTQGRGLLKGVCLVFTYLSVLGSPTKCALYHMSSEIPIEGMLEGVLGGCLEGELGDWWKEFLGKAEKRLLC